MRTPEEEGVVALLQGKVVHLKVENVTPYGQGPQNHNKLTVYAILVEMDKSVSFQLTAD